HGQRNELEIGAAASFASFVPRRFDHGARRIRRDDVDAAARQTNRVLAGAAPELQDPLATAEREVEARPNERTQHPAERTGREARIVVSGQRVEGRGLHAEAGCWM